MRIDVLTLFPQACEAFFSASILGRARQAGHVTIACHQLRDYSAEPHRKVDDRPYGGGPGMILMCQPVCDAVEKIEALAPEPAVRVLLTPGGRRLDQVLAKELAAVPRLLLICGRYEGFDERIRLGLRPLEVSIGDYVLSGGEAAAIVVTDVVVRLLPGVLGADEALTEESFTGAGLEYPQYTRPRVFREWEVPEVLLSGDHAAIRRWREQAARRRTQEARPDLLQPRSRGQNEVS